MNITMPMPKNFDPLRREKIANFIAKYVMENKKAPTIREITKGVGLKSVSSTYFHLEQMGWTAKGFWRENKKELINHYRCPMCMRKLTP